MEIRTKLQLASLADRLRKMADRLQDADPGDPIIVSVVFNTTEYSDAFTVCADANPQDAHVPIAILAQSITQISHSFCERKDDDLVDDLASENVEVPKCKPKKSPPPIAQKRGRGRPPKLDPKTTAKRKPVKRVPPARGKGRRP